MSQPAEATSFAPSTSDRDIASVLHPTTDLPALRRDGALVIERGQGIRVWDEHGNEYIEAMAGLWCTALGYGVEELAEAAAEQIRKLSFSHLFAGRSHEPAVALAEKLREMAPIPNAKSFSAPPARMRTTPRSSWSGTTTTPLAGPRRRRS